MLRGELRGHTLLAKTLFEFLHIGLASLSLFRRLQFNQVSQYPHVLARGFGYRDANFLKAFQLLFVRWQQTKTVTQTGGISRFFYRNNKRYWFPVIFNVGLSWRKLTLIIKISSNKKKNFTQPSLKLLYCFKHSNVSLFKNKHLLFTHWLALYLTITIHKELHSVSSIKHNKH